MSDVGAAGPADKIQVGAVVRQIFSVIGRNASSFFALSAVLVGVPTLLLTILQGGMTANPDEMPNLVPWLLSALVSMVTSLVLQGALTYVTVRDLNGVKVGVAEALSTGLRHAAPLFAIGLLVGLGTALGLLLLIVPGIIVVLMWSVAAPVRVAERRSIFDSLSRSADLTKGNRWRIFGLFLLFMVAAMIIQMVVGLIGLFGGGAPGEASAPVIVAAVLYAVIAGVLSAAGGAVLYVQLRQAREGVGAQDLAALFD